MKKLLLFCVLAIGCDQHSSEVIVPTPTESLKIDSGQTVVKIKGKNPASLLAWIRANPHIEIQSITAYSHGDPGAYIVVFRELPR